MERRQRAPNQRKRKKTNGAGMNQSHTHTISEEGPTSLLRSTHIKRPCRKNKRDAYDNAPRMFLLFHIYFHSKTIQGQDGINRPRWFLIASLHNYPLFKLCTNRQKLRFASTRRSVPCMHAASNWSGGKSVNTVLFHPQTTIHGTLKTKRHRSTVVYVAQTLVLELFPQAACARNGDTRTPP